MPHATVGGKKATSPLLSIVIVHWNTPELLRACLASLARHPPAGPAETIVVDCASQGHEINHAVEGFDLAALVKLERNDGYAAGCNAGAAAAAGDLIFFLNADTTVTAGALDRLAGGFDLNPRVGLIAPLLLNTDLSIQSAGYRFPGAMNLFCDLAPVPARLQGSALNGQLSPGSLELPYAVDYALGAALAIRRDTLDLVGGWDENYGMYSEEIELARRMADFDWTRLVDPRARIVHHGGASTSQRPDEMVHALWRSRGRYHRRWNLRGKQIALRLLVNGTTMLRPGDPQASITRRAFAEGLGS